MVAIICMYDCYHYVVNKGEYKASRGLSATAELLFKTNAKNQITLPSGTADVRGIWNSV